MRKEDEKRLRKKAEDYLDSSISAPVTNVRENAMKLVDKIIDDCHTESEIDSLHALLKGVDSLPAQNQIAINVRIKKNDLKNPQVREGFILILMTLFSMDGAK